VSGASLPAGHPLLAHAVAGLLAARPRARHQGGRACWELLCPAERAGLSSEEIAASPQVAGGVTPSGRVPGAGCGGCPGGRQGQATGVPGALAQVRPKPRDDDGSGFLADPGVRHWPRSPCSVAAVPGSRKRARVLPYPLRPVAQHCHCRPADRPAALGTDRAGDFEGGQVSLRGCPAGGRAGAVRDPARISDGAKITDVNLRRSATRCAASGQHDRACAPEHVPGKPAGTCWPRWPGRCAGTRRSRQRAPGTLGPCYLRHAGRCHSPASPSRGCARPPRLGV